MKKIILLILPLLVLSGSTTGTAPQAAQEPQVPRDSAAVQQSQAGRTSLPAQKPAVAEAPSAVRKPSVSQSSSAALDLLKASIKEMQLQDSLLAGHCYLKTVVVDFLDGDLAKKKSEERLVEVTSIPHGTDIEVLVAVNGKRVSEKERVKREAQQRERSQRGETEFKLNSEELITQFDWSFADTERVNGRPATILSFKPKPGAVYKGTDPKAEKFIRKVGGRVWVDDAERAIARIEFKSTEPVKSVGGFFWTLNSFFVREERKRLPEGVWIDSTGEYFIDASALVVKRIVRRSTMYTHNYRHCSDPESTSHSDER